MKFNAAAIAENTKMLKEGLNASSATVASNAALIEKNTAAIAAIRSKAAENKAKFEKVIKDAEANRTSILANSDLIAERRKKITANHENIRKNQEAVANHIGSGVTSDAPSAKKQKK